MNVVSNFEIKKQFREDIKKLKLKCKVTISEPHYGDFNITIVDKDKNMLRWDMVDAYDAKYGYQVNHYHFADSNVLTNEGKKTFEKIYKAMCTHHWDKSDISIDYFYCSFYMKFRIKLDAREK